MRLNSTNSTFHLLLFTMALTFHTVYSYSNCVLNSTAIGCLACDNLTTQSYAFNQSKLKYTCTDILNCISITGNTCTACARPYYLDGLTNECINSRGCISAYNNTCLACEPTNYFLFSGSCYQKQIDYCVEYTLVNATTGFEIGCLKCAYIEMDPQLNCTYNSSICLSFDYQMMKCKQCPSGTIIHSDGKSCYSPVPNC